MAASLSLLHVLPFTVYSTVQLVSIMLFNELSQMLFRIASDGIVISEVSGSHGGEYEDDCVLGCCAV
jgi:hypothetical protein